DRHLALERDEALDDDLDSSHATPGFARGRRVGDLRLTLAVVAEACRLHDGRYARPGERGVELILSGHAHERRDRESLLREKALLAGTLLRDVQHRAVRPHGHDLHNRLRRRGRDVLELEGHDVDAARERADGIQVVVRGGDFDVGDLTGGCVRVGGEDMNAIAEPARGHREHAPELPAAEDAERRARQDRRRLHGSESLRTRAVCSARNCRRRSRSAGSLVARMAAASSAALMAPAFPIASVPTGTPPGICTIESSESSPFSAWLSTGTPRTGSVVWAATMPGRWAAPPAPAMMTRIPRPSADSAYSAISFGVRCAETIRH